MSPTPADTADHLALLSAAELAAAYRTGDLDPVDVTERALERSRTVGARVGAFAHLAEELSREQARSARDRFHATGSARPVAEDDDGLPALLGVPVPIKDLTRVAGLPYGAGSAVLDGTIADLTDGPAQRLLAAGTVTLGKTTVPEFGLPAYTEPSIGAPARTPWDLTRTAGGSSGGAAAAVATGIAPIAHGNDGGGSVRTPAACCGVLGFKPTRGVISPGPHATSGPGLGSDGVLARTVGDVALGLDVLAAREAGDPYACPIPAGGFAAAITDRAATDRAATDHASTGRLRIGLLTDPVVIDTPVHPEAIAAAQRAARALESAGHEIVPIARPTTPADWVAFQPIWAAAAASIPVPPEAEEQLVPLTRYLREQGRSVRGVDLMRALDAVQQLARRVESTLLKQRIDVVLNPSLSGPPARPEDLRLADPAADFDAQRAFTPWSSLWNLTGNASCTVPIHRARIGGGPGPSTGGPELPFGAQLGAVRPGQDLILLRLARVLEQADPWPLVRTPRTP